MSALSFANKFFFTLIFCCFSYCAAFAQTKSELEKQRQQLKDKINLTSKLITKNQNTVKQQQSELVILDRQIGFRSELIGTISSEVKTIDEQIQIKQDSLKTKEQQLQTLKDDYASLIRNAYKTRNSYNKLMFVFSAQNFNQAYKRINYMRQLANYRKSQSYKIEAKKKEILKDIALLDAKRNEKQSLLGSQELEKQKLVSDKNYKDKTIKDLSKESNKLKRDLRAQEARSQEISKEIEKLIAREIRENKKKSTSGKFTLSPTATALSSNFESNKGKLPWPIEKGIVSRKFGRQPHPYVKGVYVNNDGISFKTERGAAVRSIFSGIVSSILLIPGEGKYVVVSHGAYRTVYTKLQNVIVKKGEEVKTNQQLGTVISLDGQQSSETLIGIWKITDSGLIKLDPAPWLKGI